MTPLPYETVREAVVKQIEAQKERVKAAPSSVSGYCEGVVDGLEAALKLMDTGLRTKEDKSDSGGDSMGRPSRYDA